MNEYEIRNMIPKEQYLLMRGIRYETAQYFRNEYGPYVIPKISVTKAKNRKKAKVKVQRARIARVPRMPFPDVG